MRSILRRGAFISLAGMCLIFMAGQGYGVVIDYTYDENGNLIERKTNTTVTPPSGTITINNGDAYTASQNVTLTLTCTGCTQMQFSNDNADYTQPEAYATTKAWTLPAGDGEKTVWVKFIDAQGVSSSAYPDSIIFDTVLPTGTITINSGAAYTNNPNVTLMLTCNDDNGCSQMQFSNDGTTYSDPEAYTTTKAWTLSAGDGPKTVYVKYQDTIGGWSTAYNDSIVFDTTPPTTTPTPPGGVYQSTQTVTLTCSDGTGSGCDKIYYTTNGSDPTTSSPVYSAPITITPTATLKYFAVDNSGISEAIKIQTYTQPFIMKWGSSGSGNGQFKYSRGIALDSSGNVYVTDGNIFADMPPNNRIQKFTSTGTYITKWGTAGTGNGQFNYPEDVATDSSGNVYIVDTKNNRVQKFTSTGTYITKWGSSGTGNGQFNSPMGIAIDSSGNIYVADTNNNRIQKFSSDGTFITKWGSLGTGNGQFTKPGDVTVDSSGNIYVADTNNCRVQKFTSTGTYITKWGSSGTGNGQFNTPRSITVDSSGNIYVADTNNHRIQKSTSDGIFVSKYGSLGNANGQFRNPMGIVVDSSNKVYVADTNNCRIQVFYMPTNP